ncbi:MAG: M20/M25/M40 family metallo-hydrolase [Candidatus Micrarchaeota archaeon]|nr:M20/M25/M40 family metallo-hydrolase [Candidatus Micrarchaeota archaeon]
MITREEATLRKLISIDSTFPNEAKIASFIAAHLRDNGFAVTKQHIGNNRYNVFAQKGSGKSPIMFYGHMDTVPVYGKWNGSPWVPRKSNGRLYGLGSCDMKAGVAAAIEAAKSSKDANVKLLFCSDEENISKGAWAAVGRMRPWFKGVRLVVSGEPGANMKHVGGANIITAGRRGRVVFGIDVYGLSSHGAMPKKGLSALDAAARLAVHMPRMPMVSGRVGTESLFVREFRSKSSAVSVPESAYLEIDMHTVPPTTIASAKKRIEGYAKKLQASGAIDRRVRIKVNLKKRETRYMQPYQVDTSSKEFKAVLDSVSAVAGKPQISYGRSVADDNVFANELNIPVVVVGPRWGNEHSANEWVSINSYMQIIDIYRRLIDHQLFRPNASP